MNKKIDKPQEQVNPLLRTVEQMSPICGIGENKLRIMMEQGEIDYIQNGNRRLLAESAIWDWYERNKVRAIERTKTISLKMKREIMEC